MKNRGIQITCHPTGRTENYRERIDGDYWVYSEDREYLEINSCIFCDYEVQELYWGTESWKGDLTEEAKIRRAEEARKREIEKYKEAQTEAIINAMRRR